MRLIQKHRLKFISITTLLILIVNPFSTAQANELNTARVVSVEQVTKGPYSIGDVVSFKLTFTSDKLAIRSGSISGVRSNDACLGSRSALFNPDSHKILARFSVASFNTNNLLNPSPYITAGTFTALLAGQVLPCASSRFDPIITLIDAKGVNFYATEKRQFFIDEVTKQAIDSPGLGEMINQLKINTIPTDLFASEGQTKLQKIDDQVNVLSIPKNPKVKKKYALPKFSQGQVPIGWEAKSTVCVVEHKPTADLGGTLKILSAGTCKLNAAVMITDKYNLPTFSSNFAFSKQGDTGPFTAVFTTKK